MMKHYAAPQIEWIRFEVEDIMTESGTSDAPGVDIGDEVTPKGEAEPW